MNKVMLDLGIIQINWYSFFIFLAMATAAFLVFKESKKKDLDQVLIMRLILHFIIIELFV